jgi:hypothetical protein
MLTNDKKYNTAESDPRWSDIRNGTVGVFHSQCEAPSTCTCQHETTLAALRA